MPRAFRFQPPSLPGQLVVRRRLLDLLEKRWDRRVTTVVAGPGFGKTSLLAAAVASDDGQGGRDVWLSCEPRDESGEHLVAGLAESMGVPGGGDLDAVLDAVWAVAPTEVCLVLDDVHEVPPGSDGAAVLARMTTDLSANGHLVLASRDTVPVPLARLAATAQLVSIGEAELVFDAAELAAFAALHHVDPGLLAPTGGWPALVELTVGAPADLVGDFLWQEVLGRIGEERSRLLARFAAAGGGDDEIASALAGRPVSVDELVESVPLVERWPTGWAGLHPLWEPALRRVVTTEEAAEARRQAASVHRRLHRFNAAVELLVEAEAWDGVLEVIREAERERATPPTDRRPGTVDEPRVESADFGRWVRLLPPGWRRRPEALLAAGLELKARSPAEALVRFGAAAEGFRERQEVDGELAAISHEGIIRWWMNDLAGLMELYERVLALAAAGSASARVLAAIGVAGVAHLQGDSATVLSTLGGIGADADAEWLAIVHWLRSVAHRREGYVDRAHDELDRALELTFGAPNRELEVARLRADWLAGRVDHAVSGLAELHAHYLRSDERYLAREVGLELAAKTAWLGETERAGELVAAADATLTELPSVLAEVLETIARAGAAVADADETAAARLLDEALHRGGAALGRPESWYWRDRATVALIHVLVPSTRPVWDAATFGPALRPGPDLARALEAARAGDLSGVRAVRWPDAGVIRAHLPARWAVELAAAGTAARNPPPDDLLAAIGSRARTMLRETATAPGVPRPVAAAAKRLATQLPSVPSYRLSIGVLGPLEVWCDGVLSTSPEFRRLRVRELLCYLVARRRVRREEAEAELWPDLDSPAHNLRVTLHYLQAGLQPDRPRGEEPFFVRATGAWLALAVDDRLAVDAWDLEARLDDGDVADRAGTVGPALAAYRTALPLWRGEPLADVPYAHWAETERTRLRSRYVGAAVRAGELLLATPAPDEARDAAERALAADPTSEPAYRLLARAHLAREDRLAARAALEACRTALADLGVEPQPVTAALLASVSS